MWVLECDIDEHYTDGEHMFHVVFHCDDGTKGVSELATVIADREVPVLIRSFETAWSNEGVKLQWSLGEGADLSGFNIYRSDEQNTGFQRINGELLPAGQGNEYTDRDVRPGATYWYRLGAVDAEGEWMSATVSISVPAASLALYQNVPNPFNPTTSISFALPDRARATLRVYDVQGRHVKTLVDEVLDAGMKHAEWDATDARGNRVGSGMYFYRLTAGEKTITKKMILLK
jgi:fibronectin type 3 domain-containing protein